MRVEPMLSPGLVFPRGCRSCGGALHDFLDLGMLPVAGGPLSGEGGHRAMGFRPLTLLVCCNCWLVQLRHDEDGEPPPFAPPRADLLARLIRRFSPDSGSRVVVLASLPAGGAVQAIAEPFDAVVAHRLLEQSGPADLLLAHRAMGQSRDLQAFIAGVRLLLKPFGVAVIEVAPVLRLFGGLRYDAFDHRQLSYFSLKAAEKILGSHELDVFDVEDALAGGGALRLYVCHAGTRLPAASVEQQRLREQAAQLDRLESYQAFAEQVDQVRHDLLDFLINAKRRGKSVAAYGAPDNGGTVLGSSGVRGDLVGFAVDPAPHRQGGVLPGSRLPIHPVERLSARRPDYLVILEPDRLDEARANAAIIADWGGQFVTAIPQVATVR